MPDGHWIHRRYDHANRGSHQFVSWHVYRKVSYTESWWEYIEDRRNDRWYKNEWFHSWEPKFFQNVLLFNMHLTLFGSESRRKYTCRHPLVLTMFDLRPSHYDDVIMGAMAYQITSLTIVYSTVYSGADHRKHQSSASLAFVQGIHRGPAQMARNAENVSIWWRHHGSCERVVCTGKNVLNIGPLVVTPASDGSSFRWFPVDSVNRSVLQTKWATGGCWHLCSPHPYPSFGVKW